MWMDGRRWMYGGCTDNGHWSIAIAGSPKIITQVNNIQSKLNHFLWTGEEVFTQTCIKCENCVQLTSEKSIKWVKHANILIWNTILFWTLLSQCFAYLESRNMVPLYNINIYLFVYLKILLSRIFCLVSWTSR